MKHLTKLCIIATLLLCACSKNAVKRKSNVERVSVTDPTEETMEPEVNPEPASLTITSSDLIDGEWNSDITSSIGSNRTPELSWNAIDGAEEYVIYMIDTSANNWLHWRASGLTDTHLDPGSQAGEYVGPYPPSGTHTHILLKSMHFLPHHSHYQVTSMQQMKTIFHSLMKVSQTSLLPQKSLEHSLHNKMRMIHPHFFISFSIHNINRLTIFSC